ncbi:unnamed protein product [Heterobilharzia americana]|nr:unnamed protein product [Heterobilharzia americana]
MYGITSGSALQSIPAFLSKLKLLVDDEETNDLIYWDPLGTSFHIRDGNRLAKELLPQYFKHNNLSSFVRQLNMYGFRKINRVDASMPTKSDTEDMEFSHPFFIRNKDSLLSKIQRKSSIMCSPVLGTRNQNLGVRVPFFQSNGGVNGLISGSSPHRPITATDFMRLAETVRHLRCNQETLSQQIGVLKSENQLLYRELSDLREHHDKQSQLIQTLFTFLSAFAKEGRSASVCIGQTKRKALPSIASSSSRFPNKSLKLNLPQGFQLDRSSVQPFQLVQTADLLGPSHKRPKFDVRTLSTRIGNGNANGNVSAQISDIGPVVQALPSNLQLTPVSLRSDGKYVYSLTGCTSECGGNTQSLVNNGTVKVQDVPTYCLTKVEDNAFYPTNEDGFSGILNVEDNICGGTSNTPCSQTDSHGLSDVISTRLDGETDESICDLFLNCDSQSEAEVTDNSQLLPPSTLKYLKFDPTSGNSQNKKERQEKLSKVVPISPNCTTPFLEGDSGLVSTTLQDIDSLPWEKDQDGGFDFNLDECAIPLEKIMSLDINHSQTENSSSSSSGLITGSEIIPIEATNIKACDDVIQFLRSEIPDKKMKSGVPAKTLIPSTVDRTCNQSGAVDLSTNSSVSTSWKSKLSANNRLTISASPKVKRKQRGPVLMRKENLSDTNLALHSLREFILPTPGSLFSFCPRANNQLL